MLKPKLAAIVAGIAAVAAASAAYAAIPDGNGVIHGCYGKPGTAHPGAVRVIDSPSESCASMENPLAWNKVAPQGPTGYKGAKGDKGDAGPQGPPGFPEVWTTKISHFDLPWGASLYPLVGKLSLPAGKFLVRVTGNVGRSSNSPDWISALCYVDKGGTDIGGTLLGADDGAKAAAITATTSSASPFTLDLYCGGAPQGNYIADFRFTAMKVGGITAQ